MSDHLQQQILKAFSDALAASGINPAAQHVHLEPEDPLPTASLPAWIVSEDEMGERISPATIKGMQARELMVKVVSIVTAASLTSGTAAKAARNLGRDAEKVIYGSAAIKALAIVQLEASVPFSSANGDQVRAMREQTWRATYYAGRLSPDALN